MKKKFIPTSIPGITKPSWAESYMTVAELRKVLDKLPPEALVDWDDVSARGIYAAEVSKETNSMHRYPCVILRTCIAGW
jgi:hypothetical protein